MGEYSPMIQQYFKIKEKNKDCIVFFRLGDFYEMFFDDAKIASQELQLTLTGRDCGMEERAPMCGVPYHSCDSYIERLVARGYKVAICEQTTLPDQSKGIVERDVVRVITPGTIIDQNMLNDDENNFLASIFESEAGNAVAFCDISTGEIYTTKLENNSSHKILSELSKYNPREIIINSNTLSDKNIENFVKQKLNAIVTLRDDDNFDFTVAYSLCNEYYKNSIEYIDVESYKYSICAVGALIIYLKETQKTDKLNISSINFCSDAQYMGIDIFSRRNLELTSAMRTGEKKGTLLWVLDKTKTSMGARLLRSYIEKPLIDIVQITNRLNAVKELKDNYNLIQELSSILSGISDIERLITKVIYATANARDVLALGKTLQKAPLIKNVVKDLNTRYLKETKNDIVDIDSIITLILNGIDDNPKTSLKDGEIIKDGFNDEIDRLRNILNNSKNLILNIEEREKQKTSMKTLKVGYNKVFGYYIEITKSNLNNIPEGYIRKQTLANCERFITEELKQLENEILTAQEKITTLEYNVFCSIRDKISNESEKIQKIAKSIAKIDVICSFAEVATKNNYTMPSIDLGSRIDIKDGRHPVVEKMLTDSLFVPNDTLLEDNNNILAIITGPNMAGKSTYMRQVALIVLMAQIGCFVPATYANIGIVDQIFTRVGASDDLASGQSTFMLEMSEVASILKYATKKSLIIFDEIGRGTSTFDGMSIARAVLEYVCNTKKLGSKSLFATHYHELTELEGVVLGVQNYNIAVKKRGDDITFLRKIVRGGADDSYGIEVAKLAGVPNNVIDRAKEILRELESDTVPKSKTYKVDDQQIINNSSIIFEKLKEIDINVLTPIEALNIIYELKKIT